MRTGLMRKSYAPSFIASTAVSTVPYAVIMITAMFGRMDFAVFKSSIPSTGFIRMSDIIKS